MTTEKDSPTELPTDPPTDSPGQRRATPALYLRSILFWLGFIPSTVIFACLIILLWLAPLQLRYRLVRGHPRFNLWWLRVTCGLSYRLQGMQNLPSQPSILYAKHQSTWETLAIAGLFPPAAFVAKRELLRVPFFGWGMAALRYLTIDRSAGKRAVMQIVEQARDRRQRYGLWVAIFPEGTRRAVGDAPDYKIGGAIAATELGMPLVPIAHNAGLYWPRHSFIKWPGEITLIVGQPIDPEGKTASALTREARDWIEARMVEIGVGARD